MLPAITIRISLIILLLILPRKITYVEDNNERAEKMNKEDYTYWDDITKED